MNSQFKHRLKRATSRQSLSHSPNRRATGRDSDDEHDEPDSEEEIHLQLKAASPARLLFPSPGPTRAPRSAGQAKAAPTVFGGGIASNTSSTVASSSTASTVSSSSANSRTNSASTSRPGSSHPSPRKRKRLSSNPAVDRFIPSTSSDMRDAYSMFDNASIGMGGLGSAFGSGPSGPSTPSKSKKTLVVTDIDPQQEQANTTFTQALSSELFPASASASSSSAVPFAGSSPMRSPARSSSATSTLNGSTTVTTTSSPHQHVVHHTASSPHRAPQTPTRARLLNFATPTKRSGSGLKGGNIFGSGGLKLNASLGLGSTRHEIYYTSPIRESTSQMLTSPQRTTRPVPKQPFKVLDAPDLMDDFYLNLVDWSSTNVLAVGLGACVYLWAANTSKVVKLCDLADDTITGIAWERKGSTLAIGTQAGLVHIYDTEVPALTRTFQGHGHRVGALAWTLSSANASVAGSASYVGSPMTATLSSGSRDRTILHRDLRSPEPFFQKLHGHRQEICGLKWNPEGTHLASGGNDNKLLVWDAMWSGGLGSGGRSGSVGSGEGEDQKPLWKFHEHQAAVKAIAWSPHSPGLLASGGGTADKTIRTWNVSTGQLVNWLDTGSQVCNLTWSKTTNEIVSTHGYSATKAQHQVCIWKYPSMDTTATLSGHTHRVLYLAMSPDGETIVTGAGDETLRFWHAFPKMKPEPKGQTDEGIVDYFGREETIR